MSLLLYIFVRKDKDMDFKRFYNRLHNIIRHPLNEWEIISGEQCDERLLFREYVLPLIILVSVTRLAGLLINYRFYNPSWLQLLVDPALIFASCFLFFTISVFTVFALMQIYAANGSFKSALVLTSYSLSVFFIASSIANLLPELYVFLVFGLYGFYLFYTGTLRMVDITGKEQLALLKSGSSFSIKNDLTSLLRNRVVQFTGLCCFIMLLAYFALSVLYNFTINMFSVGYQAINTLLVD